MSLGYLFALTAIVIFGEDCWIWFQSGVWSPVTCWSLWHAIGGVAPNFKWLGLEAIGQAVLDLPVCITIGLIGLAIMRPARSERWVRPT